MTKKLRPVIAFLLSIYCVASTSAQFPITINIPKLPSLIKKKSAAPESGTREPTNPSKVSSPDERFKEALAEFRFPANAPEGRGYDRLSHINGYLKCYANKHNIDFNRRLARDEREIHAAMASQVAKQLRDEMPKVAELERIFNASFPNPVDTGSDDVDLNPAIWADILTNREEYYNCAVAAVTPSSSSDCNSMDPMDRSLIGIYSKELQQTLDDAKSFAPGRSWYVHELSDHRNKYLLAAISPSKRAKLAQEYGKFFPCLEDLMNQLIAETKKSLPSFTLIGYDVHNALEERAIRAAISDIAGATVFKIGLYSADWRIEKNSYDLPVHRFKYGAVWVKYPGSDDGYCRIIYVNVVQDYSGGGTWGSTYGNFVSSMPAGCPAGK